MKTISRQFTALTTMVALAACGCGDDGSAPRTSVGGSLGRPARVVLPADYDAEGAYPLVVLLHGYGVDSEVQDAFFRLSSRATPRQFIALLPDGTVDMAGDRFWNATPGCCDMFGSTVDDVSYLRAIIEEAGAEFAVDPARVYLIGHSNGGFMSFRMACDAADLVTAIASVAGSTFLDEMDCAPTQPVSALAIHGTADAVIPYAGTADYPGAVETVERFASRAGCDTGMTTDLGVADFDLTVAGSETSRTLYDVGCSPGLDAELWTMTGSLHIPFVTTSDFTPTVLDWLFRHSR